MTRGCGTQSMFGRPRDFLRRKDRYSRKHVPAWKTNTLPAWRRLRRAFPTHAAIGNGLCQKRRNRDPDKRGSAFFLEQLAPLFGICPRETSVPQAAPRENLAFHIPSGPARLHPIL